MQEYTSFPNYLLLFLQNYLDTFLRGGHTDHVLSHWTNAHNIGEQAWSRQVRSWEFSPCLPCVGQGANHFSHHCALPWCVLAGTWSWEQDWESKPGTTIQIQGVVFQPAPELLCQTPVPPIPSLSFFQPIGLSPDFMCIRAIPLRFDSEQK